MLGTYVTIKVADADKTVVFKSEVVNKAFDEIKRVEDLLSSFKEGNLISQINHAGTSEVFLDEETFYVLEKAKYFYKQSGGAFDVTVLPLLELWGFHPALPATKKSTEARKGWVPPSQAAIKEVLAKVGSDKMALNKEKMSVRFMTNGMKLDLGGVGKGYAVDRAVYILRKEGVKNAIVAAAGDIYCMGRKSENEKWKVGIRDPVQKNKIRENLELEDMAVSTSGGYENFFELGGRRYNHIIDPKTGWPVENDLLSVTVLAKDNITGDALATTIFVLGKGKGVAVANRLEGIKVKVVNK